MSYINKTLVTFDDDYPGFEDISTKNLDLRLVTHAYMQNDSPTGAWYLNLVLWIWLNNFTTANGYAADIDTLDDYHMWPRDANNTFPHTNTYDEFFYIQSLENKNEITIGRAVSHERLDSAMPWPSLYVYLPDSGENENTDLYGNVWPIPITTHDTIILNAGQRAYFFGYNATRYLNEDENQYGFATGDYLITNNRTTIFNYQEATFHGTKQYKVGGNIASLLSPEFFTLNHALSAWERLTICPLFCFTRMFYNETNLVDARQLKIDFREYKPYACRLMFYGCSNMIVGPQINIHDWNTPVSGYRAFNEMFKGCTSLTTIFADKIDSYDPYLGNANNSLKDWVDGTGTVTIYTHSLNYWAHSGSLFILEVIEDDSDLPEEDYYVPLPDIPEDTPIEDSSDTGVDTPEDLFTEDIPVLIIDTVTIEEGDYECEVEYIDDGSDYPAE